MLCQQDSTRISSIQDRISAAQTLTPSLPTWYNRRFKRMLIARRFVMTTRNVMERVPTPKASLVHSSETKTPSTTWIFLRRKPRSPMMMTVPFMAPAINGDSAIKTSMGIILNPKDLALAKLPMPLTHLLDSGVTISIPISYHRPKFTPMTPVGPNIPNQQQNHRHVDHKLRQHLFDSRLVIHITKTILKTIF